jgi:DNA-binding Lrp family transcriptional regulator
MKLSDRDTAILANLSPEGVGSVAAFSSAPTQRSHAAAHQLTQLIDRHCITRSFFIDVGALGFRSYIAYFSFQPALRSEIDAALFAVSRHPYVSWLGELSGSFQYACTVCAKDISQALLIYGSLTNTMKLPWHRKAFVERYLLTTWPLKSGTEQTHPHAVVYPPPSAQVSISEMDHQVLSLKAISPEMPHAEIAQRLSATDIQVGERMQELERTRVITGCCYAVNTSRLGLSHTEISLTLNRIDAALIDMLVNFGREHPRCHSVAGCLGTWDFQFTVLTAHTDDQHRFTSELWQRFGQHIETLHVTSLARELRRNSYPFPNLDAVLA